MTTALLAAALDYAARGLPVLPLHTPDGTACSCRHDCSTNAGKHPRTLHGKDDASSDPAVVRQWWNRWPAANVGIRPVSGLVVVDVDPRNGGDAALSDLERRHGDLPRTRTAVTGSGGLHYWFLGTATVGKIGAGLDVKTSTGYVVAPPSVHICGGSYMWADESPTALAPPWLARLLAPPPPPRRPVNPDVAGTRSDVTGVLAVALGAREGGRNSALHWSACRLWERVRDGLLGDAQVESLLLGAAEVVGLGDHEARATIGSARRGVLGG